jgi:hypothetical protein
LTHSVEQKFAENMPNTEYNQKCGMYSQQNIKMCLTEEKKITWRWTNDIHCNWYNLTFTTERHPIESVEMRIWKEGQCSKEGCQATEAKSYGVDAKLQRSIVMRSLQDTIGRMILFQFTNRI